MKFAYFRCCICNRTLATCNRRQGRDPARRACSWFVNVTRRGHFCLRRPRRRPCAPAAFGAATRGGVGSRSQPWPFERPFGQHVGGSRAEGGRRAVAGRDRRPVRRQQDVRLGGRSVARGSVLRERQMFAHAGPTPGGGGGPRSSLASASAPCELERQMFAHAPCRAALNRTDPPAAAEHRGQPWRTPPPEVARPRGPPNPNVPERIRAAWPHACGSAEGPPEPPRIPSGSMARP
jgi:hypothetical protein